MDSSLPNLLGSESMIQYVAWVVQQLEADQGRENPEARDLLQQLQQQMAIMQSLSEQQSGSQPTDIQLAQHIDSVEAQLSQLEASLSAADESTMQLLGQGTSRWLENRKHNNGADQQTSGPSRQQHTDEAMASNDSAISQADARDCSDPT